MFDYTKAAGQGTDTIDRGVLGQPFINIIQKGSPEFDETHPKFKEKVIEGCRPGNILFEPERLILAQPLTVVPLAQHTHYVQWRANKKGFAGNRDLSVTLERGYRKGNPNDPKTRYKEYLGDDELVYTMTFMVLFLHADEWKKGIIAFQSTQLKAARLWSKAILAVKFPDMPSVKPPIFAAKYHLTTAPDSNEAGGWFGWNVTNAGLLKPDADQELLERAFDDSKSAILNLGAAPAQPALEAAPAEQPY